MRIGSRIIAILFMALGVFVIIKSAGFQQSLNPNDLGPALFPRMLAGLLILLSIGILYVKWEDSEEVRFQELPLSIFTTILAILYFYIVEPLGFVLSSLIFLIVYFRILRMQSWVKNIVYSVALVGVFYLTFVKILSMPLPAGRILGL